MPPEWPAGRLLPACSVSMRRGQAYIAACSHCVLRPDADTRRWCYAEPENKTLDEDVAWCHRARRTHGFLPWVEP